MLPDDLHGFMAFINWQDMSKEAHSIFITIPIY